VSTGGENSGGPTTSGLIGGSKVSGLDSSGSLVGSGILLSKFEGSNDLGPYDSGSLLMG